MQKRSHKLLAASLMEVHPGFESRGSRLAFLFGSFQPDCNPLSYLKGSVRSKTFGGHNFTNSNHYIFSRIDRLQRRCSWSLWQYYTLGKLTHYVADAFTFPHNEHFTDTMLAHHMYETDMRDYLENYLPTRALQARNIQGSLSEALSALHRQYMTAKTDIRRDVEFILEATSLLMSNCRPTPAAAYVPQPAAG